jgi:AraC-like DNA-binding protein
LIISNRLFLNPNIKLKDISIELNLSEGYISQLINKHSNSNFNDFINKLRIEESKRILKDIDFKNYTITAIGLESGFNSKSSFYSAFKKFTHKTPTEFRNSVRNV